MCVFVSVHTYVQYNVYLKQENKNNSKKSWKEKKYNDNNRRHNFLYGCASAYGMKVDELNAMHVGNDDGIV